MPNGNYSIDFQVYRIDLSFCTRKVLVSGICGGECADEPFMQFAIDNKALIQVDSKLIPWPFGLRLSDMRELFSTQTKILYTFTKHEPVQWVCLQLITFWQGVFGKRMRSGVTLNARHKCMQWFLPGPQRAAKRWNSALLTKLHFSTPLH